MTSAADLASPSSVSAGRSAAGFVPPPYPYERLGDLKARADALDGGCVDLSIGTPCDAPPAAVVAALAASGAERGYPPSVGTPAFREAAVAWMERRLGVAAGAVTPTGVAACIGTKEFVAGVPQWLRLRSPDRNVVLYPDIAYPTYEMGAILAGCRAVPYDAHDLSTISAEDAARALCLWVNTPGNPTGELVDLGPVAEWGRAHEVPVFSDECYVEFTWTGRPRTILEHGLDGVVAVHSLSKRSNLAGVRAGFYAGDPELVTYLAEVRKHAGFMLPGPTQAASVVALGDDVHVDEQRERYRHRIGRLRQVLAGGMGLAAPAPDGAFYLWVPAADGDGWALARRFAAEAGVLVSPGEFYGPRAAGFVRLALVQPDARLELVSRRLGVDP